MTNKHPITECIETQLQRYLDDLKGTPPNDIYQMVLGVVEKPMLELVMQHAKQNQSLAAQFLGINRNTLHKKLLEHKLIYQTLTTLYLQYDPHSSSFRLR